MYLISNGLAVDAIPGKEIITHYVDTVVGNIDDFIIIDVRVLRNGHPNPDKEYLLNIIRVTSWLQCNQKVVICSSVAKSRSTAVAVGVLVKYFKMDFYTAMEFIKEKVPVTHITSLKRIFCIT